MAHRASVCGHLTVTPSLNAAEFEYLSAFALSRRHAERAGPYDVPMNPAEDSVMQVGEPVDGRPTISRAVQYTDLDAYNTPTVGQPALWCPWMPSCGGTCLHLCDDEKMSAPAAWLQYLIDHFLAPEALSGTSGISDFEGFTYNHSFRGGVAVHSMESNQLSLIEVAGLSVVETILAPGDPDPYGYFDGLLPA